MFSVIPDGKRQVNGEKLEKVLSKFQIEFVNKLYATMTELSWGRGSECSVLDIFKQRLKPVRNIL